MKDSPIIRQGRQDPSEPWAIPVPEAAKKLSVSRSKAYALAKQGILPTIHVGASLRVPVDRLREFIDSQLTTTD